MHQPSQPIRHARFSSHAVEFTMKTQEPANWADFLDVLLTVATGVFPGPVLEKLIDRMEGRA
jgi:hypothetical protein